MGYEYKVVPAPSRGTRAKGVKGAPARFAVALEQVMNMLGSEGWEYQRTDTLPSEERQGLTNTTTTYRSVMVFRRARADDIDAHKPRLLDAPPPAPPLVLGPPDSAQTPQATSKHSDTPLEDDATAPEQPLDLSPALRARAAQLSGQKTSLAAE